MCEWTADWNERMAARDGAARSKRDVRPWNWRRFPVSSSAHAYRSSVCSLWKWVSSLNTNRQSTKGTAERRQIPLLHIFLIGNVSGTIYSFNRNAIWQMYRGIKNSSIIYDISTTSFSLLDSDAPSFALLMARSRSPLLTAFLLYLFAFTQVVFPLSHLQQVETRQRVFFFK